MLMRAQALLTRPAGQKQLLRLTQNRKGFGLHQTIKFLSEKPWEDQFHFWILTSALCGQDRMTGRWGHHITDQGTAAGLLHPSNIPFSPPRCSLCLMYKQG